MPNLMEETNGTADRRHVVLRQAMIAGVVLGATQVGFGLLWYPTTLTADAPAGVRSLVGASAVLLAYGLVGTWGPAATARAHPQLLAQGVHYGVLGGVLFAAQMLVGYLVPLNESQNALLATITFSAFALLLLVAGIRAAHLTQRVWLGVLASVWSALIASLIWFNLLLLTYYVFLDTPQELRQFTVDQTLADYVRSGMRDLRAFIMQDYLGGGFFHLLFAPLAAVIVGAIGGLVVKRIERF